MADKERSADMAARATKGQRDRRVQGVDPKGIERRFVHEHLARALAGFMTITKKPKVTA